MPGFCRICGVSNEDTPSNELIHLLDIDLATTGKRAAAAIQALSEEVLLLQEEVEDLQRQLTSAETEADRDTLVPVFNRRAFERELAREISVSERYGSSLCIVFIDLDRFKLVNDRFGHSAGDEALIHVGKILALHTRDSDLVGRLGGDEFAIALTHADFDACVEKAKALADQIALLTVRDTADETVAPMFMMKASRRNRGQD